jgi:hypothetical protein
MDARVSPGASSPLSHLTTPPLPSALAKVSTEPRSEDVRGTTPGTGGLTVVCSTGEVVLIPELCACAPDTFSVDASCSPPICGFTAVARRGFLGRRDRRGYMYVVGCLCIGEEYTGSLRASMCWVGTSCRGRGCRPAPAVITLHWSAIARRAIETPSHTHKVALGICREINPMLTLTTKVGRIQTEGHHVILLSVTLGNSGGQIPLCLRYRVDRTLLH